MYQINDLVLYSTHGICKINSITEKDFSGELKKYYELVPLKDLKLQIHIPVDSTKIQMIDLMSKKEAISLIHTFKTAEVIDYDRHFFNSTQFSNIIANAEREKMVALIVTLLTKKHTLIADNKKLPIQETKALGHLQGVLFNELAYTLNKPYEEVVALVEEAIA